MKSTPVLFFTLIAVLISFPKVNAQLYEVSLDDKINRSSLIIEGKVVSSVSYQGVDSEIYTANKVKVYKIFKGGLDSEFVSVITMGGQMGDFSKSWTHLLKLETGESGVFFLKDTRRPFRPQPNYPDKIFEVFSSSQGFLKYSFRDGHKAAFAPFCNYDDVDNKLFGHLSSYSDRNIVTLSKPAWELARFGGDDENCIIYEFDVGGITPLNPDEGFEVKTDVYAKMSTDSAYLNQASIVATYDTEALGENIVQNQKLVIDTVGVSADSNYEVTATDLASNKVEIKIKAISYEESSDLEVLTTAPKKLINIGLLFSEIVDPGLFLDYSKMKTESELYNPETERPESFECLDIKGDFDFACSPPIITSFSPAPPSFIRAGTDDTLTIHGMCFDSIRGSSFVEFTNSREGPTPVDWVEPLDGEYISWSDTMIKVIVPSIIKNSDIKSSAGTGRFRVNRGAAGTATSPLDLNIRFAALNFGTGAFSTPASKGIPIVLADYNGMGGQSIYYASNFKTDTNAVKAFERALVKWKCTTFVNYVVVDSSAISNTSMAGRIEYANLPTGVMTTLASTDNTPYTVCVDSPLKRANRGGFTVKFNDSLFWHTSLSTPSPLPSNTFDLESRALHELGHTHLLNHSNQPNDLMYFTDLTPPYRREISANDSTGGVYIMSISTTSALTGCQTEMTALSPIDCGSATDVVELGDGNRFLVSVYPNPTNSEINLVVECDAHLLSQKLLDATLYDLFGRQLSSFTLSDKQSVHQMAGMESGIYILTVSFMGEPLESFKIYKQ